MSLNEKAKTKVVILGSCKYAPYEVLLAPNPFDKKLYVENHEQAYAEACERFYPAIKEADVIFVYAPDGIGQHTKRDLDYAKSCGKLIGITSNVAQQEIDDCRTTIEHLKECWTRCTKRNLMKYDKIKELQRERVEQKQKLRQLLDDFPKFASFDHITRKFADEDPEVALWLLRFGELFK